MAFGVTLVALGILMLIGGIAYHVQFMLDLRHERIAMTEAGLIHGKSHFPISLTLITATISGAGSFAEDERLEHFERRPA